VRNREAAKDVIQESFIKVFKSLKWFNRRSRLSTWIYRIVYNEALDRCRADKRRVQIEERETAGGILDAPSPADESDNFAQREIAEKIRTALNLLPMKVRTVAVLRYVEGLTYDEICDVIGCARGVAQRRLRKAGVILREMLKREIADFTEGGASGTP
jgi:RNA polymerase sigma-70 factor (ECF subfamily)